MTWVWIWTAVIVATLIFEFITSELVCIWFSASGVVSLILALCGVPYWVQLLVFVIVSVALLLCLRKICLKILKNSKEKTNLDNLVGKKFVLIDPIGERDAGTIKINGVVWACVEKNNKACPAGSEVEIVEFVGNKVVVKGEN